MPTFVNKYELYQQVLKLEFIREFHALVEVANGRGEFKADFTDKILALVGKFIEPAMDVGNIVLPGVPALFKKGAEAVIDQRNESRHQQKTHYFLQRGFEYNPDALTVLADEMSLVALKRYQWFVSQLEHDSVIYFAKAGVERMLEYLARKQLNLNLQHLLDGLFKGHSGAYMSGYFNTQLTPIDCLAERIPLTSKIKGAMGFTRVTAEGIYGRSGLLTGDDSLKLLVHVQLDKNKAKHKILADQQEQSRFEKIKEALSKEGRERWFDYGYTKEHPEYTEEPKYGYALVSTAEVSHYYGDEKTITARPVTDLKSPIKDSLTRFSYEIIPFTKRQLANYLAARREEPSLTLLTYLKEQLNAKTARLAYFEGEDRDLRDLDLSGTHLDDCVFDECIFPADLSNTTLRNSFLRHADFKLVEKAQGLDLSGAHAEYLQAAGANLSQVILRSANLFGANLVKANLTSADILGAHLVESNLQEVISPHFNLDDIQSKQAQLTVQQQRLEEKQNTQSAEIAALRKTVGELQANNHLDVAEKLDQFIQERAARESLARYCHSEIEKLTLQAQQQQKLSQDQAERLDSLKEDLADLQKLQAVSQEDSKQLLSQFEKLGTQVDAQGSQLIQLSQALDQLISSTQNQFDEHEQRLRRHSEEMQVLKQHLEEKKPELFAPLPALRLQQIQQELSKNYQNRAVMFEFAPNQATPMTLPITEKTFIHLALVAQRQQQQKEREIREELKQGAGDAEEKELRQRAIDHINEDCQRQQLLNSWEMLSQVQEPIGIHELWLEHKNEQSIPQHVLIEGSAGIGKTTLCGFVAAQWSQQKLWTDRFEWVLWIPLRNLIDTSRYPLAPGYSVKSLVLGECFDCLPNARKPGLSLNEQDRLWQQLEAQADRVLYVLDGFDEIAGYEKIDKLDHLKTAISQLLQSKHILMTTRPQVINARLLKEQQTRRLVTLGLSDDNIPPYVEHYFKAISSYSEEKQIVEEKHYDTSSLIEALKVNQTLWSVSHVPLHLSLICLAYAEGKIQLADLKQNFSLTQLYQQIVSVLLQRYLKEKLKNSADFVTAATVEHDVNTQRVTQFLEEFAFRGMAQYDLILDETLLSESLEETQQTIEIIPALIASGFLKQVNNQGKLGYQFVHLTFQEFFAARYLVRRLQQANKFTQHWAERFHQYKHIPRFAVMLWFTAGLLKNKPMHLQQFFQLLQAPPQDEVGLYHLGLVMRCVAEADYPKELTAQVSQHLCQLVDRCWLKMREGYHDRSKYAETQILEWLKQQRLLMPKIRFSVSNLNNLIKELSYKSLVFDDNDFYIRQAAADVLGALNIPTAEILPSILALLNDEKSQVREGAARALGQLKVSTPEVLKGLIALLEDNECDVKYTAAGALRELKVLTPEALQGLVALLRDHFLKNRKMAALALGELKPSVAEILPHLRVLFKDQRWQAREGAIMTVIVSEEALGLTVEVIQNLVMLLNDEKLEVKTRAAFALGRFKVQAPEIFAALLDYLKDNESHLRQAAAQALGELKPLPPEIVSRLMAFLKDEQWQARDGVARALGELKLPTPEILQGLVSLLKDNEKLVRQAAARALGQLKVPTPEILQALMTVLRENKPNVKQVAVRALGELKAPTPEILKALVVLLKDKEADIRLAAAQALARARALGEMRASTPEILLNLVPLLKEDYLEIRNAGANALIGALGESNPPTPEVLQSLVALLKDDQPKVFQAVFQVLDSFSTPFLLKMYFQQSCHFYQSWLQTFLLNTVCRRWQINRQAVKIANQEIHWLEQGEWQHLSIPRNHPHFQSYFAKRIKECVGSPLSLTFSTLSETENVTLFSSRPSSSSPSASFGGHKDQRPQ